MKKNIRDYKKNGLQFSYLLDSIDSENESTNSDKEKVIYFFYCFNKEYNFPHNVKSYPNLQKRIAEYLKGLPSCISIAFTNYNISSTGKNWGYCKTEKQTVNFINNWFSVCALRLIQLANYFSIEIQ